jgi:uncharacterized protein
MNQQDEKQGTRVSLGPENAALEDVILPRRDNRLLAAGELLIVSLIFVADWCHLIPYSKTPFLFGLGWISLRWRGMRWRDVGLAKFRNWRRTLIYGAAAGIGMSMLELFVTQPLLVKFLGKQPDLEDFRVLTGNVWLFLILLALAWVQAGVGEEGVYRGYLMNRVADLGNRTRGSWLTSLIVVSALFGLAHTYQGITGVMETVSAGLLLGFLYLGCGRNLAVPIVAHAISDTLDFTLIFLGKYPGM